MSEAYDRALRDSIDEPQRFWGRAAEAIDVEYELLEPVVDPERATAQEPLHPERPTMGHGYRDDPRPNVLRSIVIRHGDPDVEGDVVSDPAAPRRLRSHTVGS